MSDGVCHLQQPQAGTLALAGTLGFANAAACHAQVARALHADGITVLDLGGLERADSAALACVLAWIADRRAHGRALRVSALPEGLRALARVCEVEDLLDAAARG